jgi:hypothetical protein
MYKKDYNLFTVYYKEVDRLTTIRQLQNAGSSMSSIQEIPIGGFDEGD